jgi:hypothetical protein
VSGQLLTLPLYLREIAPGTRCIGGMVGSIVSLDVMEKEKVFPQPVIEPHFPDRRAPSLIAVPTAAVE